MDFFFFYFAVKLAGFYTFVEKIGKNEKTENEHFKYIYIYILCNNIRKSSIDDYSEF